jgi:hypothetical protein
MARQAAQDSRDRGLANSRSRHETHRGTADTPAESPTSNRYQKPRDRSKAEGRDPKAGYEKPDHQSKTRQAHAAERGAGSLKGRGIGSPFMAFDAMLALFAAFVRLDQCRAGAKNSREGEKQSAYGRTPNIGNGAGDNRRQSAEGKADDVLVPAAFLERSEFDANNHELSDHELLEPEGDQQPNGQRGSCGGYRRHPNPPQQLADHKGVKEQGEGA